MKMRHIKSRIILLFFLLFFTVLSFEQAYATITILSLTGKIESPDAIINYVQINISCVRRNQNSTTSNKAIAIIPMRVSPNTYEFEIPNTSFITPFAKDLINCFLSLHLYPEKYAEPFVILVGSPEPMSESELSLIVDNPAQLSKTLQERVKRIVLKKLGPGQYKIYLAK